MAAKSELWDPSLYRFLAKEDWDAEQVKQIRLDLLNRNARRALQAMQRKGRRCQKRCEAVEQL